MAKPLPKSEFERYLDSMIFSLRIQTMKRPEEWVRWGSIVGIGLLVPFVKYPLLIVFAVLLAVVQWRLASRRLKATDRGEFFRRSFEENLPKTVRRAVKKGKFDTVVGLEARASLERSAESANGILAECAEAMMFGGLTGEARKPYSRPGASTEAMMKSALNAISRSMLLKVKVDAEALDRLREVESGLETLHEEAIRMRRTTLPGQAIPGAVATHLEEIRTLRHSGRSGE